MFTNIVKLLERNERIKCCCIEKLMILKNKTQFGMEKVYHFHSSFLAYEVLNFGEILVVEKCTGLVQSTTDC